MEKPILNPETEQAIHALKEGKPVTMADLRVMPHSVKEPIMIVNEKGENVTHQENRERHKVNVSG